MLALRSASKLIFALIFGALAFGSAAFANSQNDDRPRVVILDVSGSMNDKAGFRWPAAQAQLGNYLREMLNEGDDRLTSFIAFGHTRSWSDAKAKLGVRRSIDVPADSVYCQDVSEIGEPRVLDADNVGEILEKVSSLEPQGMTPIVQAIKQASEYFKPEEGGEVVVVSDWDRENCVPKGDLCTALRDSLSHFAEAGGTIELRYIWILPEQLRSATDHLKGCYPSDEAFIEDDNPKSPEPVQELADQHNIDFFVEYEGEKPLNAPANIYAGSQLVVTDPTLPSPDNTLHNGAIGRVVLFEGPKDFLWTVMKGLPSEATGGGTVNVTESATVNLVLQTASVTVEARNHSNDLLTDAGVSFRFEHAVDQGLDYSTGKIDEGTVDLVLLPGPYTVTVESNGQIGREEFELALGQNDLISFKLDVTPGVSTSSSNTTTSSGNHSASTGTGTSTSGTPTNTGGSTTGSGQTTGGGSTTFTPGHGTTDDDDVHKVQVTLIVNYPDPSQFGDMNSDVKIKIDDQDLKIGENTIFVEPGTRIITVWEDGLVGVSNQDIEDQEGQTKILNLRRGYVIASTRGVTKYTILPSGLSASFAKTITGKNLNESLPAGDYEITAWQYDEIVEKKEVTIVPTKPFPLTFSR